MSKSTCARAFTSDWFDDAADDVEGVDLRRLPPFTTLLVRTVNSIYHVAVAEGREVYVQGGVYFPHPTLATLDGSRIRGNGLKGGWLGIGLLAQIRSADRCVVTSPVRGITIVPASGSGVQ